VTKRMRKSGTPELARLGRLLAARRRDLDPAFYYRADFARARGINLRMLQDVENDTREDFPPATLEKLAEAYGVTFASLLAVSRDMAAGLEPAPPPQIERGNDIFPGIHPALRPAADAEFAAIEPLVQAAQAAHPEEVILGEWVFGGDPDAAARWDHYTSLGWSLWQRITAIAVARALDPARQAGPGNGLRAVLAPGSR
jgi:transcriptional regulator with XRE-family HTH domain